jgi:hypothetical protein
MQEHAAVAPEFLTYPEIVGLRPRFPIWPASRQAVSVVHFSKGSRR